MEKSKFRENGDATAKSGLSRRRILKGTVATASTVLAAPYLGALRARAADPVGNHSLELARRLGRRSLGADD